MTGTAQIKPATEGEMKQLWLTVLQGIPTDLPRGRVREHIEGGKSNLHQVINMVLGADLSRVNKMQLGMVLRGVLLTFPNVIIPEGQLSEDEPIRQMFPKGWYMQCPDGIDLAAIAQNAELFDASFYNTWFLESYGEWKEDGSGASVERIPTEKLEIFISDPSNWLIPGSKGRNRDQCLEMGQQFGQSLPEGWVWEEPSEEALTLAVFEYHRQTGEYPLNGPNYARCTNRCRSGYWLRGGYFGSSSFDVGSWGAGGVDSLGALRWAVRYPQGTEQTV